MRIAAKRFGKLRTQQGVTLIELVISIVILSIAMVAVMNSFSFTMKHSADPLWRNKTLKLAQLYLDEILAKNYDHNTPVGGVPLVASPSCTSSYLGPDSPGGTLETRAVFNDVDDYDGLLDSPPVSITGALDSSYSAYDVSVLVDCDGATVAASGASHAKKVSVSITPPGQSTMTFSAYKGNF
jgi:MSHA pilin protein MshD